MSTKQTLILVLILIVIIGAILLWGGNGNKAQNPNDIGTTTEDQTGVLEDQPTDTVGGTTTEGLDESGAVDVNGGADASADVDVQSR